MKKILFKWLPVICWSVLIFYLCSRPLPQIDIGISHIDLVAHTFFYSMFAILLGRAFELRGKNNKVKFAFLVVLVSTLFGLFIEWYQSYIPGRDASVLDGIANLGGAIIGVFIYLLVNLSNQQEN